MHSTGLFVVAIAASLSAQTPPATASADVSAGRRIFEGQCAPCHGIHGEGGRGPTLHIPRLRHAPDDAALAELLGNGIPGTAMPGFFLSEAETAQVSAYVRVMGRQPAAPVSGDAERGRTVYQTKGCPTCHIAEGAGRALGPDLNEVGARRSVEYLRRVLTDPASTLPEDFLLVRAVVRTGEEIEGARINEDSFTIQLRDREGAPRSFRKAELADLARQPGKTWMPAYGSQVSAADLDDLLAYLAGLRGTP
jgi:cytochrome c oxidase cbb3-type subunit 3